MKLRTFFVIAFIAVSSKAQEVIPSHIGGFTIRVTPPGNEYYEAPVERSDKGNLPDAIKQTISMIAPSGARISSWDRNENGEYSANSVLGEDRYYFTFNKEGKLTELRYRNYPLYKEEFPNRMVIRGSMKPISPDEVPLNASKTLNQLEFGTLPSRTYTAETVDGKRFIVVINGTAYFVRPDGQIQAAGSVQTGALQENDSSNNMSLQTDAEVMRSCDSLLSQYRKRFDVADQIRMLRANESQGVGFRFIVMGDSRSNADVWSSIIAHISELRPKPEFIVSTGDLVPRGYAAQFADYFVSPLLKTEIPFLVAIGNHDCGVRDSALEFRYLFGENSLNYSFDYRKFRFIMLDNASRLNENGESLPWLEKTLSGTPQGISTIVFAHQPPPVVPRWAWHGWDQTKCADQFVQLITRYHGKYVFLGHIHSYSTATVNGIPYTVSGGGGAELYMRFGKEGNVHHYIICDVLPDGTLKQQVVKFYKDGQ
ncbi:MAG: metallophosphoesterase [Bacteroidota bacterium]